MHDGRCTAVVIRLCDMLQHIAAYYGDARHRATVSGVNAALSQFIIYVHRLTLLKYMYVLVKHSLHACVGLT